jgi:hypothetical protein
MDQPASADRARNRSDYRLAALRRFAFSITVLNALGHTVLGFEQSWAHPVFALLAAYGSEVALEFVDARTSGRRPRYAGPPRQWIDFLLSAHITGLAVSMLLYPGERIGPLVFAAVVAIASKSLIRARLERSSRHVFNPSNIGITVTLLVFPTVGIAPPYQFTENLGSVGDLLLPALIVISGSLLNWRLTGRLPLIAGWLGGFVAQAVLRSIDSGAPLGAALAPITGTAFVLYTFYMVTDPATTPDEPVPQLLFGAAVAFTYGVLMAQHVVFGLFFALSIVCAMRASLLWATGRVAMRSHGPLPQPAAVRAISSATEP